MACSSADWVLGLARLISSAISSWAKIGPLTKRKLRRPAGAVLQHLRADDVGGHEVGRELDALGVEPQHLAQRLDQQRLGEAGHADQQRVAAGQDGDERALDHLLLAEDDRRGGFLDALDALAGRFDAADDGVVGLGECCS